MRNNVLALLPLYLFTAHNVRICVEAKEFKHLLFLNIFLPFLFPLPHPLLSLSLPPSNLPI